MLNLWVWYIIINLYTRIAYHSYQSLKLWVLVISMFNLKNILSCILFVKYKFYLAIGITLGSAYKYINCRTQLVQKDTLAWLSTQFIYAFIWRTQILWFVMYDVCHVPMIITYTLGTVEKFFWSQIVANYLFDNHSLFALFALFALFFFIL